MANILSTKIENLFNRWLARRMPADAHQFLTSKNIFIFPTRFGFSYLAFILLLFLLGTNYQNNVIILFSYVMISLFVTCMLHSFFNLSGLTIVLEGQQIGYAKKELMVPIKVKSTKSRFDLTFEFPRTFQVTKKPKKSTDTARYQAHYLTISSGETTLHLPFTAFKRGLCNPGRIKISSQYSLGLFNTWTRLDFGNKLIIAPMPVAIDGSIATLSTDEEGEENAEKIIKGTDDFYELKPYIEGEPLTHVAWKQLARGQGWLSKKYQQNQGKPLWLKLKDMPTNNREMKLTYLCYLVLEFHKSGKNFGVILAESTHLNTKTDSGNKIAPSSGKEHLQNCLIALANCTEGSH